MKVLESYDGFFVVINNGDLFWEKGYHFVVTKCQRKTLELLKRISRAVSKCPEIDYDYAKRDLELLGSCVFKGKLDKWCQMGTSMVRLSGRGIGEICMGEGNIHIVDIDKVMKK